MITKLFTVIIVCSMFLVVGCNSDSVGVSTGDYAVSDRVVSSYSSVEEVKFSVSTMLNGFEMWVSGCSILGNTINIRLGKTGGLLEDIQSSLHLVSIDDLSIKYSLGGGSATFGETVDGYLNITFDIPDGLYLLDEDTEVGLMYLYSSDDDGLSDTGNAVIYHLQ